MTIEITEENGKYRLIKSQNGKQVCGYLTSSEERLSKKYREWLHREEIKHKISLN